MEHNTSPPPPYTPSDTSTLEETFPAPQNLKSESLLTRGLQVPTRSAVPTSGFTYPPLLSQFDITAADWDKFTTEVITTARMNRKQWTTAVGKGLGVMAIGGLMVGLVGAIPAYYVARRAQRSREEKNMILGSEELRGVVERWNQGFFEPRGVLIRVDLPFEEVEQMEMMDVLDGKGRDAKGERKRDNEARKARIVIIPLPGKSG
ncbi:hypothetical protein BDV23DRAFT_169087 [Aspergillus alliaceus]|uniref:Uncharacterized protein n=1 Tax=Petromyces alliaceus TaxID=209559 RepID=A0A5N6FXA2_PETAA|nr:uncharacterized protein BDW43DRAFT_300402 [Aspergillus alliaceus]KAB8233213.1 hypothetical protein BDW43DRAFT_300402 [Aspergillus alliaceus]KAE8395078.1 hypothetical protein BDV23DRAFT_169087 [Aspergillus alliaceus]